MGVVEKLAYTASCVTTLPFLERVQQRRSSPSGLAVYLPAIGLILGVALSASAVGLSYFNVNQLLIGVLVSILWLLLTGGIHLDGLMDTADGIFSHQSRERVLEIMKDSRVGNFGVMAGFVILIIKCGAIAAMPADVLPFALLLIPIWSRWCEVFTIGAFPYLREEGLGKVWHDTTKFPQDVFVAMLVPWALCGASVICGCENWLMISAATIIPGLLAAYGFNLRLSGQTGDTYGAVVEISEAIGLLVVALSLSP